MKMMQSITAALLLSLAFGATAMAQEAQPKRSVLITNTRIFDGQNESLAEGMSFVSGTLLVLLAATLVESALWGCTYLVVGALNGFETALYFSMVTYTGLGYGDVVLPPEAFRLLSAIEAANGILMLGWSTAVTLAVMQRVYGTREARR